MDMSLIQGTITSLTLAGDIAKGLIELKSLSEVQGKVIELQSAIMSAQTSALSANAAQAAMIDEVAALKKEIADIKAWETEKQRYQLYTPWERGGVVYALKESMCNSEPPHYICTNCYEKRKKSILQPMKGSDRFVIMVCPGCSSKIHTGFRGIGNPKYV